MPLIRSIPDANHEAILLDTNRCGRCPDPGIGCNHEGEWLCDDCMAEWFAKDFDAQKWGDV